MQPLGIGMNLLLYISIYPEYPYGPYEVHRISAGCRRDACN